MSSTPNIPGLSRRDVIRIAGVSLAAAPLLGACGASESSSTPDAGSSPDAGTAADAGVVADAGTAADAGTTITRAWATGGTAAMVAAFSAANGIDMTLAANLMSDLCIPPEPAEKTAADELHWGEGGAVRVSAEAAPAALTTN